MGNLNPVLPVMANTPKTSHSDPDAERIRESQREWPTIRWERGDYYGCTNTGELWRKANPPERHAGKIQARHAATGKWGDTYRRLKERLSSGPLVVLVGKRGTGKTQLAVSLLADVCRSGEASRYLKAMDLFREIRNCYRKDGPNEVETVDKLCKLGLLIVDEAHERSDSEWENRTLTNIIDRRYDAVKATILVSNLTRQAFGEAVGPSVISRIHESGEVIECDWDSYRQPQPK